MRDNRGQIIGVVVQGVVSSPKLPSLPASPYVIGADGYPRLLPPQGGIVYNVKTGDSAFGWQADMVQPGVSISATQDAANQALNVLASIGNEAVVLSGRARGARGTVTGKSGRFAEHVIIDFAPDVLDTIAIGDAVGVRAFGRGLRLPDHPEIQLKSLSPALLDLMEVEETDGGITVGVQALVPPVFAGAGNGLVSESGTVQIQTEDSAALESAGLTSLRLGDIVAFENLDSRWGSGYREGATTIGIISHGDSPRGGYGPGATPLMTAIGERITAVVRDGRNVADLLQVGRARATAAS
jgi:hypothetical protein